MSWDPGTKLGVPKTKTQDPENVLFIHNLRPAKHTNMHQEHIPTSLSSFPRAIYSFSREYDFFVCLSEMLRQKKCVGYIAGVFIEMSARIVNMKKVWLLKGWESVRPGPRLLWKRY